MYNYVEQHNTNQVSDESHKSGNNHQKQKIDRLTEELKRIKSGVEGLQDEAKILSSENNIAISKVHHLQININAITAQMSTSIKEEEAKEKIQQLK